MVVLPLLCDAFVHIWIIQTVIWQRCSPQQAVLAKFALQTCCLVRLGALAGSKRWQMPIGGSWQGLAGPPAQAAEHAAGRLH